LANIFLRAQRNEDVNFSIPIPERIIFQINSVSTSQLLSYIRNSLEVVKRIKVGGKSEREKAFLTYISGYICECAEYILIEKESKSIKSSVSMLMVQTIKIRICRSNAVMG
jgi:hypothetical protein